MRDQLIAIIPARGGSKRVPGKNIRLLSGKPLIVYSIEAALGSGLFSRVVVSTDSPEIAEISQEAGAEIPFLRSADLSDDLTPVSAATIDMLLRLDPAGERYETVAQLMPNCPLRTDRDVFASYEQFRRTNALAQISVVRYGWQNPWWAMQRDRDDLTLVPLFPREMSARSQDLPELFCPTGAIWWGNASAVRQHGTFHIRNRSGWEITWQNGIDIDTLEDFALAEAVLLQAKNRH